jgi:hypothetical protein
MLLSLDSILHIVVFINQYIVLITGAEQLSKPLDNMLLLPTCYYYSTMYTCKVIETFLSWRGRNKSRERKLLSHVSEEVSLPCPAKWLLGVGDLLHPPIILSSTVRIQRLHFPFFYSSYYLFS